jgi:cytochrome c oxidase assembly factor CtaG
MKKGIASNVKLVVEAYILWGNMVKSDPFPRPTKNAMAVKAIATAMGTLIKMSTNSTRKIINVSIL